MAFPKYQTKEVLNKVLNAGEDGLNVDLADSVTVTVDSEFPAAAAITDNFANPTTTSAMSMLMGWDTSTWDRVQIGDGTAASALRVTIASDSTGVLSIDDNGGNISIDDGGNTITVDGTVTANLGTTDNAVLDAMAASLALLDNSIASGNELQVDVVAALPSGSNTIGKVDLGTTDNAVLDAIAASLAVLDDWDDSNFANVNMNLAGSDAQAGEGTISATTQRVTIATDDDGVAHLATIAGAVSTQMQVDIVADGAGLATDANLAKMLYGTALVVDYGSGDHSLGATYEAFHIGVGGDISLDCATSGSNIVFKNVASGQLLPVRATVVNQTGTTATNIVALKA